MSKLHPCICLSVCCTNMLENPIRTGGSQQAETLCPAAAGIDRQTAAVAGTQAAASGPAGGGQGTLQPPKRLHSELGGTAANAAAEPQRARAAAVQQAAAGPAAAPHQAATQPRKASAMGSKRGLALVAPGSTKRAKTTTEQQAAGAAPDAAPASGQSSQAAIGAAQSQRPAAGDHFVLSPNGLLHVRPTVIIADQELSEHAQQLQSCSVGPLMNAPWYWYGMQARLLHKLQHAAGDTS